MEKPIHAKPSFYAIMFEPLKAIALKYGYNLVLHGSLNRDIGIKSFYQLQKEYNLIEQKKSELSRQNRDRVIKAYQIITKP